MKSCRNQVMVLILACVGLWPVSSGATFSAGERRPPEPPQQAIDACLDKSEGTTVEMTTPRGDTMKAVCRQMGTRLVAVPEGGGPPPGGDEAAAKDADKTH
jgi:hypothetical protein